VKIRGSKLWSACIISVAALVATCVMAEDYTTPPGAPGSPEAKMKSLNQIEPRTYIDSLPYDITEPGAYYLIGSLDYSSNTHGIVISCSDVKLDLNGFKLNGTPDTLSAIHVSQRCDNIVIRNGIVRGWGLFGINATNASDSTYEELKAYDNQLSGFHIGPNSLVQQCGAYDNGYGVTNGVGSWGDGFSLGPYCTVTECKSRQNCEFGFFAGDATKITGCTAAHNGTGGIHCWNYSTIRDSLVVRNSGDGIRVGSQCRVEGNNSCENGIIWDPTGYGAGIRVDGDSNRIENNNVALNDVGIEVMWNTTGAGKNLIVQNSASDNLSAYNMSQDVDGDYFGVILDANSLHQTLGFTTDNAWSNFEF